MLKKRKTITDEEQNKKNGKEKTAPKKKRKITVTKNKVVIIGLWCLFIFAFTFAVYKNFTAIDMHTVHEREVVHEQVINTNKVENFVTEFAKVCYSWGEDRESLDRRANLLQRYISSDLTTFLNDMVRSDIPVTSEVTDVCIWNVEKVNDTDYSVLFTVAQSIKEGSGFKAAVSTFTTKVHLDMFGNMVIIKSPSVSYLPEKSGYTPKAIEHDGTVDNISTNEIKVFLETFFKLYPKATEQELVYYVKDSLLKGISDRYIFSELSSVICTMENDKVRAYVDVKYLDDFTKVSCVSQFDLLLQKSEGNWKIVGVNK